MKKTYIDIVEEKVVQKTGLKGKGLVRLYALLVLIKGEDVTLEDIHDAWSVNMNYKEANPPYCYGHDHLSIVPFDQLSKETQMRDEPYLKALKEVAKEIKENRNAKG